MGHAAASASCVPRRRCLSHRTWCTSIAPTLAPSPSSTPVLHVTTRHSNSPTTQRTASATTTWMWGAGWGAGGRAHAATPRPCSPPPTPYTPTAPTLAQSHQSLNAMVAGIGHSNAVTTWRTASVTTPTTAAAHGHRPSQSQRKPVRLRASPNLPSGARKIVINENKIMVQNLYVHNIMSLINGIIYIFVA